MRNIWNIWYEHIFWICHQNNMLFYYILLIMSCPFIVVGCVYVSVSYLQSSESNPMCRRLQFKDLLISEVHRLTKYPLLIDSMCNHVTCMCLMYNYMFLFINYGVTLFSAWHDTDVKILVKVLTLPFLAKISYLAKIWWYFDFQKLSTFDVSVNSFYLEIHFLLPKIFCRGRTEFGLIGRYWWPIRAQHCLLLRDVGFGF